MRLHCLKYHLWRLAGVARCQSALLALLLGTSSVFAADDSRLPPLTTVSGSPHLPGKFVWADLVTDNVPAAQAFYARLFGWTFRDYGSYTIAFNEERPLAGMFQRTRPVDQPQAKPRWIGYFSVGSVAKAQSVVTAKGGRVLAAPQKLVRRGEQAVFADPEGAIFGVVKSSSGDPQDFLPDPGDWIWVQLLSRDARNAATFYCKVGGYEVIEQTVANRASDFVLASKGYARATVRSMPLTLDQVRPNWLLFVRVKNIGESLTQAKQLGGKVLIEPKPELFEGKVAIIADPTGAAIGLLEWSEGLLKGER